MKPEVRHTTFFKMGESLAVFARKVVDVDQAEVLGHKVVLKEIPVDESVQVQDIQRRFWAVTEYPPELVNCLGQFTHAVRGTSDYEVGQPNDDESLKLFRWAQEKVKVILFPEQEQPEATRL
ncbi:MAG: hypothetical protein V4668_03375 [Patescibacteria group bacterium]